LVQFVQNAIEADPNPLQTATDAILAAVNQAVQQLGAHQTAEDINTRLTNLGNALAVSTPVLQGLKADLSTNLTAADVEARIEKCSQAVDALSNLVSDAFGGVWYAPYQDQVYWTDYPDFTSGSGDNVGYNAQVPGQDATAPAGNVYSWVLALPAFLQALCIWLTVARALAPTTFVADYNASVLTPAWQFLKEQHDKILNQGIIQLSPIYWSPALGGGNTLGGEMPVGGPLPGGPVGTPDPIWAGPAGPAPKPIPWTGSILYQGLQESSTGLVQAFAGVTPLAAPPGTVGFFGASIEYGAVEVFSGFSAMGTYVLDFGTGDGQLDPTSSDLSAYNKFQLRLVKKSHDVYIGVGLPGLWNTINTVGAIVGQPPLPRPNPADWSFRTISDIVGGLTSLRAIGQFIVSTPPDDTPSTPSVVSFRTLLEV